MNPISLSKAVGRGARGLCPRCGQGKIFRSWGLMHHECPSCGLLYEEHEGDTWGFMYVSTGFITGLFIIAMFLVRPSNRWIGLGAVVVLSVAAMIGTSGIRKGIAVGLDYKLREKA